jgi:hypothetical protein
MRWTELLKRLADAQVVVTTSADGTQCITSLDISGHFGPTTYVIPPPAPASGIDDEVVPAPSAVVSYAEAV